MKAIRYVKNRGELFDISVTNWDEKTVLQLFNGSSPTGEIYLISDSSKKILAPFLSELKGKSIPEKHPKVQLMRALKLNGDINDDKPRALSCDYRNPGALKRSLFSLLKKHYTSVNPMCIIIIPQKLFTYYFHSKEIVKIIAEEQGIPDLILDQFTNDSVIREIRKDVIGSSPSMLYIRLGIYVHSRSSAPVLLFGEGGTGKQYFARQIFKYSTKFNKVFVIENCLSFKNKDFDAEMFGYIKGTFTNAVKDMDGLLIKMNGGTLYFDEISELSLVNQVNLLRFIETGEVTKIGSIKPEKTNVRIIFATSCDPETLVKQGKLHQDLYFLLQDRKIRTVSLREYPDDIPLLASYFWENEFEQSPLSKEVLDYLKAKRWPGNALQLRCVIESILDYFPGKIPTIAYFKMLEKIEKDNLVGLPSDLDIGEEELDKVKSNHHIIRIQNTIRKIKVELRPLINHKLDVISKPGKVEEIKTFVEERLTLLNDLGRNPIYFRSNNLYNNTRCFCYELGEILADWDKSINRFREIWYKKVYEYYKQIFEEVFELVWLPQYRPKIKRKSRIKKKQSQRPSAKE
jgi:DNA-binding NtrC family response regulator